MAKRCMWMLRVWACTCVGLALWVCGASAATLPASVLDQVRIAGGIIVHLGCGDGAHTAALRQNDSCVVHGLAATAAELRQARRRIQDAELYGPVSIDLLRGSRLPYTDGLVNRILVEDRELVPRSEIMRVLVPNGIAVVRRGDNWETWSKPWPDSIDEWTHFMHGPDNNAVARDTTVGPPAHVQWAAGPLWQREHDVSPTISALVSAKGRLFYIVEKGPVSIVDERIPDHYTIVARDAFNGVKLWERPMGPGFSTRVIWGHVPVHLQRRLVAVDDRLYVTPKMGDPVVALDAATGDVVRAYEGTEDTSEIVCDGGMLALVIRKEGEMDGLLAGRDGKRLRRGFTGPVGGGLAVMGVDADTGARKWRHERSCVPMTLAQRGGRVYFVEDKNVVCLDAATGTDLWSVPFPAEVVIPTAEVVVCASGRNTAQYSGGSKSIRLAALSVRDGSTVWSASGDCLPSFNFFYVPVDVFVARGQVWGLAEALEWNSKPGTGHLIGLDLQTGEPASRFSLEGAFTAGHHTRCYKAKATESYLLLNKRGIEFLDIAEGATEQDQWIRGACRYGILPCNGLIYAPSHACVCYPGAKLDGFHALAPARDRKVPDGPPLDTGPGYGSHYVPPPAPAVPETDAWPTYRHDPGRSGTTPTVVPAALTSQWQAEIGGKLSAPTAAGGRIYIAAVDRHTLYCLDAADGRERWRFVAGGRIDSPPTVHEDLVLVGSRDGACYCLDAATGDLVWRFRAAPAEALVGAHGQLESAWPLFGSVLVSDDVAYVVAGRSSFVDGGMVVCGLDVRSGRVRYRTALAGPNSSDPGVVRTAGRMPGAVPDILSSDGKHLYLRHVMVRPDLAGKPTPGDLSWGLKSETHLLAGSGYLDDSLFNRSTWRYGTRIDRSQLLVVDGNEVYGLRMYWGISWNCPVFKPGEGYLLFRQDVGKPVPQPPREGPKLLNRIPFERYTWHSRVPVRVGAMVLTGSDSGNANEGPAEENTEKRLFVAGQPDEVNPEDPLGAFEGRKGGILLALSGGTGEVQREHRLDAPPVWDGLIAYRNRLIVALQSGNLVCLGAREEGKDAR